MASKTRLPGNTEALHGYRRLLRRRVAILVLLACAVIGAGLLDLATGPSGLAPREILRALWDSDSAGRAVTAIMWEVRLPQTLLALGVGIALALAGAEMQTILDNPLASPFTLGISSAASFGAALAIVLGISIPGIPQEWLVSANAFLFAIGSIGLLLGLTGIRSHGANLLVLCGIALFFTFNALVALLQFVATQQSLQQLVFWIMGSLARASWDKLQILGIALILIVPWTLASSWRLTAIRFGEERARSFGIDVRRLRIESLLRISVLTATAISFVGTIGFVGLAGPHIARLMVGEDHRFFLPASAMVGATIMLLASAASKMLIPGVLIPVGIVTAMIGLPVFFSLIFSVRARL